jgi:hypothetical protein
MVVLACMSSAGQCMLMLDRVSMAVSTVFGSSAAGHIGAQPEPDLRPTAVVGIFRWQTGTPPGRQAGRQAGRGTSGVRSLCVLTTVRTDQQKTGGRHHALPAGPIARCIRSHAISVAGRRAPPYHRELKCYVYGGLHMGRNAWIGDAASFLLLVTYVRTYS